MDMCSVVLSCLLFSAVRKRTIRPNLKNTYNVTFSDTAKEFDNTAPSLECASIFDFSGHASRILKDQIHAFASYRLGFPNILDDLISTCFGRDVS